jgi:hypothetical protein
MIREAERDDFAAVAAVLSERDRRTLMAIAPEPGPLAPLMRLADIEPIAATFLHDGRPVAIAGAVINDPRTASVFVFGADDLAQVGAEVLQFLRRTLLPALAGQGVRRVYHVGAAGDEAAASFLRREFGARKERDLKGRNGEALVVHGVALPLQGAL